MSNDYIVALRNTPKMGAHAGIITWSSYESKDEFDSFFKDSDGSLEVVEEGVTEQRAVELTLTTPDKCYLMSAVEESCDPATGELDSILWRHNLEKALAAIFMMKRRAA